MSSAPRLPLSICVPAFLLAFPFLASAAEKKSPSQVREEAIHQTAEYLLDQCVQLGWQPFGIHTLITMVVVFLLLWPASKLFTGENGTWKKSLAYTLQFTGIVAIFVVIAIVSIRAGWLTLLAGLGLSVTFATIGLARHVYEISIPRAIGMYFLVALTWAAGDLTADMITGPMPWQQWWQKSDEEQKQALAKWQVEKKEREQLANSSTPTAPATPPTVQELYANLQKTRAELNVNDPAAVARFNEQVAAYNAAKAAAAPPPAPAPPATPKASESAKAGTSVKKKSEKTESKKREL